MTADLVVNSDSLPRGWLKKSPAGWLPLHLDQLRSQCSVTTWWLNGSMTSQLYSGRTSVSGQRSFAVLCSTRSWWVTTYVGKPSAIGQPTRPTQPFILSRSISEWWAAIRCLPPHSVEAPSGERLRGKGRHGVLCSLKAVWSMPEPLEWFVPCKALYKCSDLRLPLIQ